MENEYHYERCEKTDELNIWEWISENDDIVVFMGISELDFKQI